MSRVAMAKTQRCYTENVVKFITVDTLHVTSNAARMDPIHCIELILGFYHSTSFASYEASCFPLRVSKKSQVTSEVCVLV